MRLKTFFACSIILSVAFYIEEVLAQTPFSQQFYSQAKQDQFTYHVLYQLLKKEDRGCYLEIGAGDPVIINNTYFFEKDLNWTGISIDVGQHFGSLWANIRHNIFLNEDATQLDYELLLNDFPLVIDYLSIDVDGNYDKVLQKVLDSGRFFKVITIEHDAYRYNDTYREKERKILTSYGYRLLCPDVSSEIGIPFEDWWIHPSFFPDQVLFRLGTLDLSQKMPSQIIATLQQICFFD